MTLYDDNANTLELTGLANADTGAAVSSATVVAVITVRGTSTAPAGVASSVTLPPVSGAAGTYRAQITPTVGLARGKRQALDIRVTASGSVVGEWNVSAWLVNRGAANGSA